MKYTKERDMSVYIDDLWERIGQKLSDSEVSEADIEEAIKQVRSGDA